MDVLANCCSLRDDRKPRIWTPLGKIVGSARETSRGTEYVSFTGVPYAKPPIGKNLIGRNRVYGDSGFA